VKGGEEKVVVDDEGGMWLWGHVWIIHVKGWKKCTGYFGEGKFGEGASLFFCSLLFLFTACVIFELVFFFSAKIRSDATLMPISPKS